MRIALVFASLAVVVNGCSCGSAARACASSDDCRAGEVCLADATGASTCRLAPTGEGEGAAGGEGEVAGEGEGAASEGEGAASEGEGGEGEGEGEGAVCGDNIVTAPEQCDDGNSDDKDGCSNACTTTTATASAVVGATPVRGLSLGFVDDVSGSTSRGFVIATGLLGELWYAPPGTTNFSRVDPNRPLDRTSLLFTSPSIAAVAPDQSIVYLDQQSGFVHRIDPRTVAPDVIFAGNGDRTDVPTDPANYTFAGGPQSVQLLNANAIDIDNNGTTYLVCDKRVVAIDPDGTTRVVAGAEANETTGTAAQKQRFNELLDVSVQHDASGAPIGLWLAGVTQSNGSDPMRVDLVTGDIVFFHGSGVACDNAPLSGCQVPASAVVDDGDGGFFALGSTNLTLGSGIIHVSASDPASATVTTFASTGALPSLPSHAALIEPGVIAAAEVFDAKLRLVHDAASGGGVENVGFIAPSRATDRTIFPVFESTASATKLYFTTITDLFTVDQSGTLAHVVGGLDLGPCAQGVLPFSAMAVTSDDTTLFFVEGGESANTICSLDLATKSVTKLASSSSTLPGLDAIALRTNDLIVSTSAGVKSVALSGGTVSSAIIASPPSPVVEIASSSAGTVEVLFADGSRAAIGAAPSNTVTNILASSLGDVDGLVAQNDTDAIVFDPQTKVIDDLNFANTIVATLAGASGAALGFRDGAASQALFGPAAVRLRKIGTTGPIVVDDGTSVRFLSGGSINTVVGSDQFEDDGDFATARLTHPSSLSCVAHKCIAAESISRNLRVVDFDTSRIDRVLGNEGAPLGGLTSVAFLDDTHAVWTDRVILHGLDLSGAVAVDSVFLQGSFVGAPTFVTSLGGGQVAFFDGTGLKTAPGLLTLANTLPGAPAGIAFDSARNLVVVVTAASPAALHFVAVAAGAPVPADVDLDANASLGAAHGIAVDDASNVYVSTDNAIVALGPSDASPRTLVAAGDALFPFATTVRALSVENGDLVAADSWTGALVRVAIH